MGAVAEAPLVADGPDDVPGLTIGARGVPLRGRPVRGHLPPAQELSGLVGGAHGRGGSGILRRQERATIMAMSWTLLPVALKKLSS